MTRGEITMNTLKAEGWVADHRATYNTYKCAGAISPMKSRGGYEYCRVHHEECVGRQCYQMTTVMRRKIS